MAKVDTIFGEAKIKNVMIDTDGTNLADGVSITIDGVVIAEIVGKSTHDIKRLSVDEFEDLLDSYIS